MATLDPAIMALSCEYKRGYHPGVFSAHGDPYLKNDGFIGSDHAIFLSSDNEITHKSPACIAAPLVTMVARNVINLGTSGPNTHTFPVRLYVPDQISITTKHLSIGDIEILKKPQHGFISCKTLTLFQSTEDAPPHFEIVLSWVSRDDTNVEVTHV